MSLKDCIDSALAQGAITKEEADALKKRYDNLARTILDPTKVKGQIMAELEAEAAEKQRRALLTEQRRKALVDDLEQFRTPDGQRDLASAFMYLHEHFGEATFMDAEHKGRAIVSWAHVRLEELAHEFRRGRVFGDLRRTSKLVGNSGVQARMDNVVRELFGESTLDGPAKAFAGAFSEVAEDLRLLYNEAGGNIPKLNKWGLPQYHDQEALLGIGKAAWIERLMQQGVLDRERMIHPLTRRPMTDAELRESLGVVWERIVTDGWSDREATGVSVGKGALFSQHQDHRFLHFKNADAWLAYARDFGNPDPYQAMMAHVSLMARDIAHMETFGPNPTVLRQYLKQYVRKAVATKRATEVIIAEIDQRIRELQARAAELPVTAHITTPDGMDAVERLSAAVQAGDAAAEAAARTDLERMMQALTQDADAGSERAQIGKEIGRLFEELDSRSGAPDRRDMASAERILQRADDMWAIMRGTLNAPVDSRIANFMHGLRSYIAASSLGMAQLSAISDPAFGAATRGFVGMSRQKSNVFRVIYDTIRFIGTDNHREAVRSGLILDSAMHVMQQQSRYAGSLNTRSLMGFLADRVITLQGLAAWTQAGKHAFGMAMQALFADMVDTSFKGLPAAVRRTLERHGFDAASWDQLRATPLYEPQRGAQFLRPNELMAAGNRDLAERYIAMILRETRYAVPEGTVRSQSLVTTTRPGTIAGELTRSFSQFKSFAIVVPLMQMSRIASEIGAGRGAQGAAYAGALLITSTALGAIAMALKDIAVGRDPRKWTKEETFLDPNMWGAALLQAGGLGIYGDFLFSQVNRFGGGLTGTVAGPIWQRVDDARNLTIGNLVQLAQGKPTHFGRELVKFAKGNTPGSTIWFLRLAYERVLMDQLQRLIDADAQVAFRREIQTRKREYGNEYWWEPGTTTPHRAPNLDVFSKR